ncbi:hypothetical protein GCM10011383_30830 [Hymenobacter cavernae]|uniref:Uncharacterized protein n=2 Tax=Hymenobacter cavernae TaxID=2044852 RepID=A0ABQ1UEL5_9BACT|nr:hypothetical protein GCM10011383_30830 [Hymenobacter cavernae]
MVGKWYLPYYDKHSMAADTAGALISLFVQKRTNAWLYLLGVPVGLSMLQPTVTSVNGRVVDKDPPPGWQVAIGVPVIGASALGYIMRLTTYSKIKLNTIQQNYEQGVPIPAKLRRKLKSKHFANAAYMREAVRRDLQAQKERQAHK